MTRAEAALEGVCPTCAKRTPWYILEGWALHTWGRHARCSVCRCITQPELIATGALLARIREQLDNAVEEDIVIEV